MTTSAAPQHDAVVAAQLLAFDPVGLGGAVLAGPPGQMRDEWLALYRRRLSPGAPWRRLPVDAPDSRLLGGLDLAATLRAGRPVAERGVLADSDGGTVLLPMAERLASDRAARIAAVMDARAVSVERDGLARCWPTEFALIALDESIADEAAPACLTERLAFRIRLDDVPRDAFAAVGSLAAEHGRGPDNVGVTDADLAALCSAAASFGIASPRAPLLALRAARAAALRCGRSMVTADDLCLAARLVLAPRATQLPGEDEAVPPPSPSEADGEPSEQQAVSDGALADRVQDAVKAALPPMLLAALGAEAREAARRSDGATGRQGRARREARRGRPIGTRAGTLRAGARLALVETLRAAAPWQMLRPALEGGALLRIRPEDIRLRRYRERVGTTAIFAVDASGSAALHRLGEAKGAVELLLGDCYARRDRVALIAFRGNTAELLLAPTHALARAKRSLAGLPGGGATPLAAALDAARQLAQSERTQGRQPLLILLTDGRANVARDGCTGRGAAEEDALRVARLLQESRLPVLVVDTAPRPAAFAKELASAMGARHLPLPHAGSADLSAVVGAAARAA